MNSATLRVLLLRYAELEGVLSARPGGRCGPVVLLRRPAQLGAVLLLDHGVTCGVSVAERQVVRVEKHEIARLEAMRLSGLISSVCRRGLRDFEGVGQLL